jgi:hypothetical protein
MNSVAVQSNFTSHASYNCNNLSSKIVDPYVFGQQKIYWRLLKVNLHRPPGCVAHTLRTTELDLKYNESLLNSFKKKREVVTFQLYTEFSVRNFMYFF